MNLSRPFVLFAAFVWAHLASLLQTAGLCCAVVAASLWFGAEGGFTAAAVGLILAGVALERGS